MQLKKQPGLIFFFKAMTVAYMFNFSVSTGGTLFYILRLLYLKKSKMKDLLQ